jgi:integrase
MVVLQTIKRPVFRDEIAPVAKKLPKKLALPCATVQDCRAMKSKKANTYGHCRLSETGPATARWRVSWKDETGNRARRHFADPREAKHFAATLDRNLENHGRRYGGELPSEVRLAFDYHRDTEAEGVPLPAFLDLVRAAVDSHKAAHTRERENTVAEIVAAFLAAKDGTAGKKQLADLKARLHRFAAIHGRRPITGITPAIIEDWLAKLKTRSGPAAPLTRSHHRAAVFSLFAWASHPARAIVATNPAAAVPKPKAPAAEPQAYTPAQARALLTAAQDAAPDLLPVLALQLFAGLRTSEVMAFRLDTIPAGASEFRVGKSKTRPRVIPVLPPLDAWLAIAPRRTGPAWAQCSGELHRAIRAVHAAVNAAAPDKPPVPLIKNGFRHSYITHRAAVTRDAARVADECGNSVQVVAAHYRAVVTEAEGKAFFAIMPRMPGENVIPMTRTA